MAVSATSEPMLARIYGEAVGSELRSLGVTMNLVPVFVLNDEPSGE